MHFNKWSATQEKDYAVKRLYVRLMLPHKKEIYATNRSMATVPSNRV